MAGAGKSISDHDGIAASSVPRRFTLRGWYKTRVRFHHMAVQVKDLARCERFYTEVLGLSVYKRWEERSVWLGGEDEFVALEKCDGEPQPAQWRDGLPGLHLLSLAIAPGERAGWEERFRAHGVEVVRRTKWTIYVRDPEGNRIGLTHYPREQSG
jgi:catechol 2,3-dioxygenase-like lactoylglutathione lyase family enzyme